MKRNNIPIVIRTLMTGTLVASCMPTTSNLNVPRQQTVIQDAISPENVTAPPQGLTAPPQSLTAPPQSLTAPPQSLTAPPLGIAAMSGKLLLPSRLTSKLLLPSRISFFQIRSLFCPPAWAQTPTDVFDELLIQAGSEDVAAIFQEKQEEPDGSISARYYIPRLSLDTTEISLRSAQSKITLLKTAPVLTEAILTSQDINAETTAVALMLKKNKELTPFDVLENPAVLKQVTDEVLKVLNGDQLLDIENNEDLQQITQQASQNIPKIVRQVTAFELPSEPLSLMVGQNQKLQATTRFSDGSTSSLVSWASSDPQVALVTTSGEVQAFQPGTTTIQATALANPSFKATLAVSISSPVASPSPAVSKAPPLPSQWQARTLAGSTEGGFKDGSGEQTRFSLPFDVAVDGQVIYVADFGNHRIRKLKPDGTVSTLAGSQAGFMDGSAAQFNGPSGVAVDKNGNIYVADSNNQRIRKIAPDGTVSTLAGNGNKGFKDGLAAQSELSSPRNIALGEDGTVYFSDSFNHAIRKITPQGQVETIAGDGESGFVDGAGKQARFQYPFGLAIGESGDLYVADSGNHRIRKVTPAGVVSTVAGSGNAGNQDGSATTAMFNLPFDVALDSSQRIYVADKSNNRIRVIDTDGSVSTLTGSEFDKPYSLSVDTQGQIYVAYTNGHVIRVLSGN